MFLMCIAYHDIEDEHCDVIKAFTQNELDTVLFLEQPPGVKPVLDSDGKPMVMRARMSLEGLRQAANVHQTTKKRSTPPSRDADKVI